MVNRKKKKSGPLGPVVGGGGEGGLGAHPSHPPPYGPESMSKNENSLLSINTVLMYISESTAFLKTSPYQLFYSCVHSFCRLQSFVSQYRFDGKFRQSYERTQL